jgi:hypothetical protein
MRANTSRGRTRLPIMVSCRFIVRHENQELELVISSIGRKCLSHMQSTVSAWLKAQYQCIQNCRAHGARCGKLQLKNSHIKLQCHGRHHADRRLASPRNPTEMIGLRRSHCVPTIPATLLTFVKPCMGDRSTALHGLAHAGPPISMHLDQDGMF